MGFSEFITFFGEWFRERYAFSSQSRRETGGALRKWRRRAHEVVARSEGGAAAMAGAGPQRRSRIAFAAACESLSVAAFVPGFAAIASPHCFEDSWIDSAKRRGWT